MTTAIYVVSVHHALHSAPTAPISPVNGSTKSRDSTVPIFQIRKQRSRQVSSPHTAVGGRDGCCGGGLSSVALALIVSKDQTVVFDLGLLRASKVRSSAPLITHPPTKVTLIRMAFPKKMQPVGARPCHPTGHVPPP